MVSVRPLSLLNIAESSRAQLSRVDVTNERTLSLHPGSPPLQSRGHHPTLKRRERERERKKEREGEKRKYVLPLILLPPAHDQTQTTPAGT